MTEVLGLSAEDSLAYQYAERKRREAEEARPKIQYVRVKDRRHAPVRRRSISIGKDPSAQMFARLLGVPTKLPGQNDEGYGNKITTETEVLVNRPSPGRGEGWYRVYATCWSNSPSEWILIGGVKYHLQ